MSQAVKTKYNAEDLIDHQGVSAIIKDAEGRILMQEHAKYGFWTVPVGKAKQGQTAADGLKEEVFEECNLTVKEFREIKYKVYEYMREGRLVKVFTHIYEIIDYEGEMQNKEPHKHPQQRFMELGEILKLPYLSDTTLLYLSILGIERAPRI